MNLHFVPGEQVKDMLLEERNILNFLGSIVLYPFSCTDAISDGVFCFRSYYKLVFVLYFGCPAI